MEVVESARIARVPVSRKYGSKGTVTVGYCTVDGSATAGRDYTKAEGELMFSPHELRKYIEVAIVDDTRYEADEEFYVHLEYHDDAVAEAAVRGVGRGIDDAVPASRGGGDSRARGSRVRGRRGVARFRRSRRAVGELRGE